jgi:hypothetical protein
MRKTLGIVAALAVIALVSTANAEVIAFWHFDDSTNLGGPSTDLWRLNPLGTVGAEAEYAKDLGSGSAELSAWGSGDVSEGNLVGTNGGQPNSNFGTFSGTTLNDIRDPQVAGSAFTITGTGNDGHYFLLELDDAIEDCVLSYATRGTSTGFNWHNFYYSTDDGATWTFLEEHAAVKTSTWALHTVNFGDVFANTSGHESNLIRFGVREGGGTNGNNRFDNMKIEGTIVPEPATLAMLAMGALVLIRRK